MSKTHVASLGNVCPGTRRSGHTEVDSALTLEDHIRRSIVGQHSAINAVVQAIHRKENGWCGNKRPLVLLFLGSSGIGKTELAKQIAHHKHKHNNKRNAFIRFDMTEYQTQHEVAKLIGSPPGYVGHEKGGLLTKGLKACPNAVVLFDEVEKADNDVLTILLQLFDEGRLSDGMGKTIDCKDAIFIMTSNLASNEIATYGQQMRLNSPLSQTSDHVSKQFKDETIEPILKRHFGRDEFLGRINEMVYFLPFSRHELNQLALKNFESLAKNAKNMYKMKVNWDQSVVDIVSNEYNPRYGARSITNGFGPLVVNAVDNAFRNKLIKRGDSFKITADEDLNIKIQLLDSNESEQLLIDLSLNDRTRLTNDSVL